MTLRTRRLNLFQAVRLPVQELGFRGGSADFKGMGVLRDLTKDDFVCGVVLYAGEDVVPFGDRFLAVPFSALWQ